MAGIKRMAGNSRYSRPLAALLLASILPFQAVAFPPYCGGDKINIGRGFTLDMRMWGGSPDYELTYEVPASDVHPHDVSVAENPIRIIVHGLEANQPPRLRPINYIFYYQLSVGYENLDLREHTGAEFFTSLLKLDCGEGVNVSARFSPNPNFSWKAAPHGVPEAFNEDRPKMPACIQALKKKGQLSMAFYGTGSDIPTLLLKGSMSLAWASNEAEKRWSTATLLASRGECKMPPVPPPPP